MFSRSTGTTTFKSDLTSQWNKQNKIKTGFEMRFHRLYYDNYALRPSDEKASFNELADDPYLLNPQRFADSTIYSSTYSFEPFEMSAYLQDKIELDELCLLYTSPSPRDGLLSRMPSSA